MASLPVGLIPVKLIPDGGGGAGSVFHKADTHSTVFSDDIGGVGIARKRAATTGDRIHFKAFIRRHRQLASLTMNNVFQVLLQ